MLNNNCIVEYYKYDINLLKPIQFICQLAYDISQIHDDQFTIESLFNESLVNEVQIDFSNLPEAITDADIIAWIASEIATFYNKNIINSLNLVRSSILLLHQSSKILYVLNKKNGVLDRKEKTDEDNKKASTKTALTRLIKEQTILRKIIDEIQNEVVRGCLLKSIAIEFDEIYQDCVMVENAIPIEIPYLKYAHLNQELIELDSIDLSDVWINKGRFKEAFQIVIGANENISAIKLKSNKEEIGIMYNDYVFPIVPKIVNVIDSQHKAEFHWIQIKEVFKLNDNKKNFYSSELITDFKLKAKNAKLSNLLSYLKENLYLKTQLLEEVPAYKKFFNSSLKISDIKYLKKLNFFISDSDHSSTLGIYSFDKIGEDATHFNLLHWYDRSNGEHKKYRDNLGPNKIVKKDVESVSALHPEISFYFITKYFEDLLECILEDLDYQFISNFHLYQSSESLGEFDFLVKNKNKFYFIEAKTTLTKFYIKEYQQKCQKILKAFSDLDVDLEFLIIGAYSNTSVEDLRIYIDNSHKGLKRYNNPNADLDIIPYLFEVPIENSKHKITCIAEPNFYNLKKVINKVCQK